MMVGQSKRGTVDAIYCKFRCRFKDFWIWNPALSPSFHYFFPCSLRLLDSLRVFTLLLIKNAVLIR